jgi:hypothetical protein
MDDSYYLGPVYTIPDLLVTTSFAVTELAFGSLRLKIFTAFRYLQNLTNSDGNPV